MPTFRFALILGMLFVTARPAFALTGVADEQQFRKTVAPILERRCLSCHNDADRKGQFSLQTSADLISSGVVVPGKPEESTFLSMLKPDGTKAPQMPKDAPALSEADVKAIENWIRAGASWPKEETLKEAFVDDFDWWSLKPLNPGKIPTFDDAAGQSWVRNPVDAFVLKKLRDHGLKPSVEADRRTLIRRLSFDLLGLPPTPEDVDAFVKDTAPDAWEKLVDRYLASPQYGERWARHWLDVVRYADTCGYDKDKLRPNAWPYRDYVIRSFNQDKPYSRFVQEQLAGDVLFPGEPDGILGLGFIAAGPWDFIGHVEVPESKIDGKVARNLDRDDMVTGTLNTFCSVTIQCARCHNHKFDPFTQQHYYGLQSVFAAVDRAERPYDTDPKTEQRRIELTAQKANAQQTRKDLQETIRKEGGESLAMLEKLVAELKPLAEPTGKRPEYGYHSQISATQDAEKWVQVTLPSPVDARSIVLHACHDEFGGIGAGFGFPVRYKVEVKASDDVAATFKVLSDRTQVDTANPGIVPVTISSEERIQVIRVTATRLAPRSGDFIFALSELEVLDATGKNVAAQATVTALDSIEAPDRWRQTNLTDGIWPTAADPAAVARLAAAQAELKGVMDRLMTAERTQRLEELSAELKAIDEQLAALPAGRMVYAAATHFPTQGNFIATQGKPRVVRLLHRGSETQPRDEAMPGTIPLSSSDDWKFSPEAAGAEGARRAALAKWITRPEHPLTWRSIVNRIWQYHYGKGLVDSPNDFGRMGQLPTHPELLDWLAEEFLRNGQSFKAMHRTIVLSSTWRQSSAWNEAAEKIDADNQFLWRMNRRRLEAEEIRDATLAVSGRMNPEMGGPGFYLFELEKTDHSPHYEYYKFNPDDARSHRRSVYRFIVRSQPDPYMTTLDCADSSQSTPRRHETLTALQALSLLNNGFNVTMARHFAARLESEAADADAQIDRAFRLLAGRTPDAAEKSQMIQYRANHGLPALCRLLLNLNEFVFVD
ncbi:MAG: DUF1553 domain-containing protein [Planctomycetaceae bacterium]